MRVSGHDLARTMPFEIVGREEELAVRPRLRRPRREDGAAALVLEGEAGIGKSTLWLAGVEHARARGLRVLSSRPAEAERGLAHVGLGDLFEDVLDDVLPALSRRRGGARSRSRCSARRRQAIPSISARSAWRYATRCSCSASGQPILLAVDDVQWLDASSSSALAFALRRLAASPVLVLLARRLADGAEPSGLEQALGCGARRAAAGGTAQRRRAPSAAARPAREAVRPPDAAPHPRAVGRQSVLRAGAGTRSRRGRRPARAAPGSRDARRARPREARRASRGRRARRSRSPRRWARRRSRSWSGRALRRTRSTPAVAAHVIERENGTIRFTHPLLSSVLYRRPGRRAAERSPTDRAASSTTRSLRARHLALSSDAPDAEVAAVLDDAATLAAERGASAVAAELAEQALRLTPPDDARRAPSSSAGCGSCASRGRRVDARPDDRDRPAGRERTSARCAPRLSSSSPSSRASTGPSRCSRRRCARRRRGRRFSRVIQCRLAWATRFRKGFVGALEHARAALELADDLDDDALRVERARDASPSSAAPSAMPRRRRTPHGRTTSRPPSATRSCCSEANARDRERARRAQERRGGACAARARVPRMARARRAAGRGRALWGSPGSSCGAARWQLAAEYADRAYEHHVQYGLEVPWIHLPIAVDRRPSRPARARPRAFGASPAARRGAVRAPHAACIWRSLGLVALQSGDPHAAVDVVRRGRARRPRGSAGASRAIAGGCADHVEALLELGRLGRRRCESSTRGRRMRDGSTATGCSRT